MIVTLMKKKFVDQYHWIKEEEMLDLVAIAQSAPGPIAVNGAIVVGFQLAGLPGVLLCVLATVLPPFVIISILSVFYTAFQDNLWIRLLLEGMQSGVAAVIASVVYDMGRGIVQERRPFFPVILMIGVFIANCVFHINAIYMILFCIILGLLQAWFRKKEECQMICMQLFLSFLKIGAFSFGGGYAALPLIQNEVIHIHHWLSMTEFTDLITISQMTPGPIAINSATFVGIKVAGGFQARIRHTGLCSSFLYPCHGHCMAVSEI